MVTVTNTIFCDKMGFKSKIRNLKDCAVNSMIYNNYYDEDIDDNLVYLESRDGLDFTGNIFRITEELSTGKYGDLKIHVHAKPQVVDKIKAYQKNYNLKIDSLKRQWPQKPWKRRNISLPIRASDQNMSKEKARFLSILGMELH